VSFTACSLLVTDRLPSGYQAEQGVMPSCDQSNLPAGVDLLFFLGTGIGALAAFDAAANPPARVAPGDPTPSENYAAGASLGAAALLTGYSMLVGFDRTSTCRSAVEAAGFESHGSRDWVWPTLILLTVGAAAAARGGGGNGAAFDPDACTAYAIRTAPVAMERTRAPSLDRGRARITAAFRSGCSRRRVAAGCRVRT
jgi:hypothetical protein